MLHVLVIGHVWPEPCSSAAGSRMHALLRLFRAQGWRVTFACAAQPGMHRADLAALGVDEAGITLNCSSFDDQLRVWQPDIVLYDRFMTEEQFGWRVARTCPDALRVLDTEDLHSLRHARHRLLKAALKAGETCPFPALMDPDRLFASMVEDDLTLRELAALYRVDLNLIISDAEMRLLTGVLGVPAALLHYCPFLLPAQRPSVADFDARAHFISIGSFRHAPNWDAVLWLKQQIWPLIRRRLPQACVQVYGSYPTPKAAALHDPATGFLVGGWVPDALAAMQAARVCLAPLRFGAGIKGKLSDAMLCGTPSVTTPIGCEGMGPADAWCGYVASDAVAFAEAAVRLYTDAPVWRCAQQRGHTLRDAFDEGRHGAALLARLAEGREHRHARRRANLTGALLRHHLHASTRYLSEWIEAKNRHTGETAGN